MAITKADILSAINAAMESSLVAADVAEAIKLCMRDLSNMGFLTGLDTTQTLVAGAKTLTSPDNLRDIEEIVLIGSWGRGEPLTRFSAGYRDYLRSMAESSSQGIPEQYSIYNGAIYLYPPADGAYTSEISYSFYDDQDEDNIEFGDEFSNALKFGSIYFHAMMRGRERYVALWGPKYEAEKEFRRLNLNLQPKITE